jgi:Phospholipase A2-like domain
LDKKFKEMNQMDVTNILVKEIPANGLAELSSEEKGLVNQVLEHIQGKDVAVQATPVLKTYEATYFGHKENNAPSDSTKAIIQENRFIKFTDKLKVHLFKSTNMEKGNSSFIAQAIALKEEYEKKTKQIVTFLNGELLADTFLDTEDQTLELPEDFAELSNAEKGETDVSVQGLPCIQDGCCSFRYNGLPWNPLVEYNWCGANCGSGTPVNSLDRCCRTHDYCYGSYSSYPGRCACDENLINCASYTDNAGGSRVITAFQAKMLYQGC